MITLILVVMTLYCAGSVGIMWMICQWFGWQFEILPAIGVWLFINLMIGVIKRDHK